jgi:hypothetical protein
MEPDDEKAYDIIAAEASKARPVPPLTKKRDGFSRQQVVDSFARAFEMIGGVQRLALWANQNPDKFYPLYSRLLPSAAINIGSAGQVVIQHAIPLTELDEHPESDNVIELVEPVRADPTE